MLIVARVVSIMCLGGDVLEVADVIPPHGEGEVRPVALFILGLGRSGTSALARVLSLSGGALPTGLVGATVENSEGYFEPRAVIHLNESILRRRGSSGYDLALRPPPERALGAHERAAWIAKIRAYLAGLPAARVVVIKEPKTTALCEMWFEAARLAGFDPVAVIAVRHPEEVIASLAKRASRQNYVRASSALTSAWWLKYTLLAERDTRGIPRVFVDYSNLLENWPREVKRVATALGIDFDSPDERAIGEFLEPDFRHHRRSGQVPEPFGTDWIGTVYAMVSAAARDESWDASELDRVFEAYQAGEEGFRTAFDGYRRYRNLNRFLHPSLVKLGLGALALAHRRRGTWA